MTTIQDMLTGQIEQLIAGAGLATAHAPDWPNRGTLHAMRGVEPVLAVGYDFQGTYATLSLSGPAVEQAPFEFLAGQHQLRQNRVCRGVVPIAAGSSLTRLHVTDRRGLTIQFHHLEFGKPGKVQGFLDVVRDLLPEAPETAALVAEADQEELARLVALVLQRPDAAQALDFVLAQPVGGPSCGCGGDHWSCDFDAADPETS